MTLNLYGTHKKDFGKKLFRPNQKLDQYPRDSSGLIFKHLLKHILVDGAVLSDLYL